MPKSFLMFAMSFVLGTAAQAQTQNWEWILEPTFALPCEFHEGLGFIHGGESGIDKGFMDISGKTVIPIQFEDGHFFKEGLAGVKKNGKWGFVDKTGKMVIQPEFDVVNHFSEGLVAVQKNEKWGVIDKTGKVIIPFRLIAIASGFSEGYIWAHDKEEIEAKPIIFDKTGKQIEKPEPHWGFQYPNGLRISTFYEDGAYDESAKSGYEDKTGKLVIPRNFNRAQEFSEGLAVAENDMMSGFGYLNPKGKWAIAPQFSRAGNFKNGLAPVGNDSETGYIDPKGKWAIKFPSEKNGKYVRWDIEEFNDGLADVRTGGGWGVIRYKPAKK
jgi:WG containing repeat